MYSLWRWAGPLFFASLIIALPKVAFPINSQVPPLARVGESFDFQFSESTFSAHNNGSLSYNAQGAPAWLRLDGISRTFTGTPTLSDVGPQTFALVATDVDGEATLQTTFIVVEESKPQLRTNITNTLAKAGSLSDQTGLSLHTGSKFNLVFPTSTFEGPSNLSYYATSSNNTPLPSWITFNAQAVTFSGVTPPPVPNPQVIGLRLIGSSVAGFSGASVTFNIVISDHTFAFKSLNQDIHIRPGQNVDFSDLQSQLLIDGKVVPISDLASASADTPDWMRFDSNSLRLIGSVPPGAISQDVHVKASDVYGNNAETHVYLDTGASMSLASPAPKLTTVPSSADPFSATSTAVTGASTSRSQDDPSRSDRGWIAAAVIVPLALLFGLAVLMIWCCKKRDRKVSPNDIEGRRKKQDEKMSRMRYQIWRSSQGPDQTEEKLKGPMTSLSGRPYQDRSIGLDEQRYGASDLGSQEELVLDSHQRSSLGAGAALMSGRNRFDARDRRSALYTPYAHRGGDRMSKLSQRSSHMTRDRRLTGLGHGRFSAGSSRIQRRPSRRCNHCGSLSVTTLDRLPSSTSRSQRASKPFRSSIRQVPIEVEEEDPDETTESSKTKEDTEQEILERIRRSDSRPHNDKRESYFRKRRASKRSVLPENEELSHEERYARLHDTIGALNKGAGRGSVQSPVSKGTLSTTSRLLCSDVASRSISASGSSSQAYRHSWDDTQGRRATSDTMLNHSYVDAERRFRGRTSTSLESEGWYDTSSESDSKVRPGSAQQGDMGGHLTEREQMEEVDRATKHAYDEIAPRSAAYGSLNQRIAKNKRRLDSVAETQAGAGETFRDEGDDKGPAFV